MDGFQTFLTTFSGGSLALEAAQKHRAQVQYVIEDLGGLNVSAEGIAQLLEQKLESKIWAPYTCKVYLKSIKKFISYLKTPWVTGHSLYKDNYDKLLVIEKCMTGWFKSLTKASTKLKDSMEDEEEVINPDDIQSYFKSKRADEARHLLTTKATLNQSHHTLVRNYLVLSIFVANCNRAGIVLNMTLEEFSKGRFRSDHFVVRVKEHKMKLVFYFLCVLYECLPFFFSGTYGMADVVMDACLYRQVCFYISHYRPKTKDPTIRNVFLTWGGNKFTCLSDALTNELQHSGCTKR